MVAIVLLFSIFDIWEDSVVRKYTPLLVIGHFHTESPNQFFSITIDVHTHT
jgi:hypothetical protein